MRVLTEGQKTYILQNFFMDGRIVNWYGIGHQLLTNGKCVVAGNKCVWVGGIGNFIQTREAPEFVGCVEYVFKLEEFLSSEWFKQRYDSTMLALKLRVSALQEEMEEVGKLSLPKEHYTT